MLGTRDYVTQERLRAGAHRALRRHRLVARRRDRRRRARARPRHRRAHAVALLERRAASPTPSSSPQNLGHRDVTVPIEEAHQAFTAPARAGVRRAPTPGLAEENLQARIRGTLLMAISNKFGWMVLTTGNKSEMATGYSTLYGDMAGGFAVIKDVPKMLVYALVRRPQPARRTRADPRGGAREAAERRAAPGPEGRGLAAAVRGARRGARGLRRSRTSRPRRSRPRASTARPSSASSRSSTAASTSGARRRRASGCRPRRSARTAGCRSPTAGRADRRLGVTANVRSASGVRGYLPEIAIATAAFLYGVTFSIVQDALDHTTPMGFNLLRFAVGARGARAVRAARGSLGRTASASDRLDAHVPARRRVARRDRRVRLPHPEHRAAAHVDVELRVHHRPLRRVHPDRRGDRLPALPAQRRSSSRSRSRSSASSCSPAPSCR